MKLAVLGPNELAKVYYFLCSMAYNIPTFRGEISAFGKTFGNIIGNRHKIQNRNCFFNNWTF